MTTTITQSTPVASPVVPSGGEASNPALLSPAAAGPRIGPLGRFLRWYAHVELPRYGLLLHWYGMNDQPRWATAPTVEIRGRYHGHRMRLDMADFFQRIAYFMGAYHELHILTVFDHALRPGDEVLDGGAYIGLVSLHAAGIVGPTGLVHAVECSPRTIGRLRYHAQVNALPQLRVHELGLSDEPGEFTMRLPGFDNNAAATLSPIPQRFGHHVENLGVVRVFPGDQIVDPDSKRPLFIKLDVEGFEPRAIRGLARTVANRRPAIMTEINSEMLEAGGSSVLLFDAQMRDLGYKPFAIDRGGFRLRHRLLLHPVAPEQLIWEPDVLWLTEDSVYWDRLKHLVMPPGKYWRHMFYARADARLAKAKAKAERRAARQAG